MTQPTLGEVVDLVHTWYPPATAEGWDAVGLVAGDPAEPVRRILVALDPVAAVVDEALAWDADLVLTHHPLLLRGVHAVTADDPKGAIVHRLVRGGCALLASHTNADVAESGVAEALAELLGLRDVRPVVPDAEGATGAGRMGELPAPLTLRDLAAHAAAVLPPTPQGVRVAGDLDALVRTIAVLPGSDDTRFAEAAAAGADVYVSSDLKHHPVSEQRERARLGDGRPFVLDTAHWASESPWLRVVAARLTAELAARGHDVEVRVSEQRTDPWTARVASPGFP
ncbi:Nif3-like dinuclear metal center hexameric protein [Sanguibacter sp. HDW7]|uniref:Nif3-like dinuclear metal center hexameric protein n=1 Tax=Sanguibacter sp. HDW7 TaxID=2714931 RepID=UPI0014078662|nr:Nif3-like dinuclear metal center hexameric protein [Sanguibacter sp. HDW7]QIK83744.1 Nif3-like dinuclear metal center hexameric protein [Sanguibacter sp. HDW7]